VPGEVGPIRHAEQVVKGLGLTADAERDLATKVREWMQKPDAITLRRCMIKGLRAFTTTYPVRNELWRRCTELWKNTSGGQHPYRPRAGSTVIQKGERIPGGLAEGRPDSDFDAEQLAAGVEVELEHSDDREVAKEIAKDHLTEDKDYYRKLKQIHKGEAWEPMGLCGGERRAVPGGFEYRYPEATHPEPTDLQRQAMKLRLGSPVPLELVWMTAEHDELHERASEPTPPGWPTDDVSKAAGHKYLKRVPTGKPSPKWRYIYRHPQKKGLTSSEDLRAGVKIKVSHVGQEGHFEVVSHDKKKGIVEVKHDESGRTAHVRERDLHRMIQSYHRKKTIAQTAEAEGKPAPTKLPRGTMADLAKGEWDNIEGFASNPDELEAQAAASKADADFAIIKQPAGYVLVSRRKREVSPERKLEGEKTDVKLRSATGKGIDNVKAQWVLVEADDIVASHKPVGSFGVHPDYPEKVQERRYHEIQAEQDKVDRIAKYLDPSLLVNSNPDAVNGAPIVTQDNVVLGGNGRTMAMQRAYAEYPKEAEKLKKYLVANGRAFGFSAADVRAMDKPVMVRRMVVKDPGEKNEKLRLLGRRMNEALTQGLDPRSEEVAVSHFVTDDVTQSLVHNLEPGQTLLEFLYSPASKDFVGSLRRSGIIDEFNKARYLDEKTGMLNDDGRQRVERVLAARFLPNASILDKMNPTVRQAIALSAPSLIAAEQAGWDLRKPLMLAVKADLFIRSNSTRFGTGAKALRTFRGQTELDMGAQGLTLQRDVQTDPAADHLLTIVREHIGTKKTPKAFRGFALRAEQAKHDRGLGEVGQTGLLSVGAEYTTAAEAKAEEALDIEFGLTPRRAAAKRERDRLEREQNEAAKREEIARRKIERQQAAANKRQAGLFGEALDAQTDLAASDPQDFDLIKAKSRRASRLMNRVIFHARMLVDAAVKECTANGRPITINGPRIVSQVLDDVQWATLQDPGMAEDLGRDNVTEKVVRGIVEAMVELRAGRIAKSMRGVSFPGRLLLKASSTEQSRLILKATQLGLFGPTESSKRTRQLGLMSWKPKPKPPGAGWQIIPRGRRGGYRRKKGKGYEYWYPGQGVQVKPHKEDAPPEVAEEPKLVLPGKKDDAVTDAMADKKTKGQRKSANELALEIVKRAVQAGRSLTDEEAVQVAQYTGKGGISGDLNQFYTRTDIAEAMWDVMAAYDDHIEKVLEPSCGSGVFIQTAPKGAKVTGVELDKSAADVAEALHGHKHSIEAKAFEEFTIEHTGTPQDFDAVIANPPYCVRTGDIPRHKPEFKNADHYFIDTSLDHVKEGGLCAMLIHPGVLNARSPGKQDFRARLLARAEVVDAFRCPDDIFKHTHCGISADILILKKRDAKVGGTLAKLLDREDLKDVMTSLDCWDQEFVDGDYFEKHPDRVLGKAMTREETGFRDTIVGDADKVPGMLRELTEKKIKAYAAGGAKDPAARTIELESIEALAEENPAVKDCLARALSDVEKLKVPPTVGNVQTMANHRYVYIGEPPKWTLMETVDDVSQIIEKSGDEAIKQAHDISLEVADLIKSRDSGEYYKSRSLRRIVANRVKEWVDENGIPGSHRALGVLSRSAPQLLDFMACVDSNGELSDVLSKDAAVTLKAEDVDRSDIMSVANYIARRNNGYVTSEDLQHNWEGWEGQPEDELRRMLLESGSYVLDASARANKLEKAPLQHVEDYLTGNLYDKLEAERERLGHAEGAELEHRDLTRSAGASTISRSSFASWVGCLWTTSTPISTATRGERTCSTSSRAERAISRRGWSTTAASTPCNGLRRRGGTRRSSARGHARKFRSPPVRC